MAAPAEPPPPRFPGPRCAEKRGPPCRDRGSVAIFTPATPPPGLRGAGGPLGTAGEPLRTTRGPPCCTERGGRRELPLPGAGFGAAVAEREPPRSFAAPASSPLLGGAPPPAWPGGPPRAEWRPRCHGAPPRRDAQPGGAMGDAEGQGGGRTTPPGQPGGGGQREGEGAAWEPPRTPPGSPPKIAGGGEEEEEEEEEEKEELDPRIREELEHLNQATEEINRAELQLDEARGAYRRALSQSARLLDSQCSELGGCIERARPYYEARRLAKEAQQETQRAALRFERAVSTHGAAREMVAVAEQGVLAGQNRLDPTWQELLNHATAKVNEAEEERARSEREHQRATRRCQEAEARVQALQKRLRRPILKSRPYFELKAQLGHDLEEHKSRVTSLELLVSQAKRRYSVALRNLEQISEQIHARRRLRLRGAPVGAESGSDAPPGPGDPPGAAPDPGDAASLLSLRTIASDLQKSDSVEHLAAFGDAASLDSERRRAPGQRRSQGGALRHHRSVSL